MSRAEARQLAQMLAATHVLAERCPTWLPHLEESQVGGAVVVFTVSPGLECLVFCNHSIWMYRADHVAADGRILEMGKPITLGFGTDIPRLMNRISAGLREDYVPLLASPAMQAAPAEDSGAAFISEALWHLDGRPPLNGRTPSLYGRDPARASEDRKLDLMTRAGHLLGQACAAWTPQLAQSRDGNVVVTFESFPGNQHTLAYAPPNWVYQIGLSADSASRVVAVGQDPRPAVERVVDISRTTYRRMLSAPEFAQGGDAAQVAFVRAAMWELDGHPPLRGCPPSLYEPALD